MRKLLLVLVLTTLSLFGASFDCSKAKSDVEKMICKDDELSKLDENLSKTFKEAINATDDKEQLKKEQFAWMKERNQCEDNDCTQNVYKTRINELNNLLNKKQSQFIGIWCSNPCLYGSHSRPWDMPCEFEVSKDSISWTQWNDHKKKFVRKYIIVEQKEGEETMFVYGGDMDSWYTHESLPNVKHKLIWSIHHSNEYARDSIEFREENWNEKDKKWVEGGSMYVSRSKGRCL